MSEVKPTIQRGDIIKLKGYRPSVEVFGFREINDVRMVCFCDKNDPRRNAHEMPFSEFSERVQKQFRYKLQIYPDVGNR